MNLYELAPKVSWRDALEAYRRACQDVDTLVGNLHQVLVRAESFGMSAEAWKYESLATQLKLKLRRSAWEMILRTSGLEKVMSVRRVEEFERRLHSKDAPPEPTEAEVDALLMGGAAQDLFAEMVSELYDYLRPGAYQHNKLKTNHKHNRYKVSRKLILPSAMHYVGHSLCDRDRLLLVNLDRLFHILNNLPFDYNTYNAPLVDGIVTEAQGESQFFRWKRFENRNVHLEFKDLEGLAEFNRIAAQLAPTTLVE
jgi:hypothetical protein